MFEKGKASWKDELPSVIRKYNISYHNSIKRSPNQASKKSNEKLVYSNLKDNREIRKSKFNLGQLVRTADIKRVFSKGDSTNYSYKFYLITVVIQDTIPSYPINFRPRSIKKIYYYQQNYLLMKIIKL